MAGPVRVGPVRSRWPHLCNWYYESINRELKIRCNKLREIDPACKHEYTSLPDIKKLLLNEFFKKIGSKI
jgi:hypothetical protein